jgi:hypothetical protein
VPVMPVSTSPSIAHKCGSICKPTIAKINLIVLQKHGRSTPVHENDKPACGLNPRAHGFRLRVIVQDVVPHLASPPRLLISSERQCRVEDVVAVNPYRACLE